MNNTERLRQIDALLADVPKFQCKPGCADCCGPLAMSKLELKRLVKASGINPKRLSTEFMLKSGCLNCPLLDPSTNKCTQYEIRPAICKIFGSSAHPRLVCPHGLGPENPLSKEATNTLVDRVLELGHGFAELMEAKAEAWINTYAPDRHLGKK